MNRKTAAFFLFRLRKIIALILESESSAMFGGEIEVDESYFGGKRKGKRGRGAGGKIPVFGFRRFMHLVEGSACRTWWRRIFGRDGSWNT